jgi:hypothetical protein
MHTPRRNVYDKEDVVPDQPESSQHLDREEIGASICSEMRHDESVPTRVASSLRCRLDATFLEDRIDGVASDVMAQFEERSPDSGLSPARILSRHTNDKLCDVRLRSWSPQSPLSRGIVLGGNQVAVPPQERVRCNDEPKNSQCRATYGLGLRGKPSTLPVCPANALIAKLLAQCLIHGLDLLNHSLQVSIHPPHKDQKKELKAPTRLAST